MTNALAYADTATQDNTSTTGTEARYNNNRV